MKIKTTNLFTFLFYTILILIVLKFTFSYLNIENGWWLRHLTPNINKYNFLHLPEDFQQYIEYVLIPLMLFYILSNISKWGSLVIPLALTLILYALNIGTALYNDIGVLPSLNYSLKICSPVYLFAVIIIESKRTQLNLKRIVLFFVIILLLLSFIGLIVFDVTYNRGSFRWPVYFSGIHTHNYVLVVVFIAIAMLLRQRYLWLYGFLFFSLVFLFVGYNVRTAIVFYFLFIVVILYHSNVFFKHVYVKIISFLPFVFLSLFFLLRNIDLDSFSSGRLTMYSEKLSILKDYSVTDYLLGRGKGSDLITTSEWWWEKKSSHNDFLTYIVENGVPYMLMFITLITSILTISRRISVFNLVMIMGYFITSSISNGLATRPLAADIFFIVYAYIYLNKREWQKQ
tara:strand:+ start:250508 stop:251707 length:1200 start_codon:yes stop_codon:yes gene_type:complete